MNSKLTLTIFFALAFTCAVAQDQADRQTYNFTSLTVSEKDESTDQYLEKEPESVQGTIFLNNIDSTVTIRHADSERTFELLGSAIIDDAYKTVFYLKENKKPYLLAETDSYLRLVGSGKSIVYALRKE